MEKLVQTPFTLEEAFKGDAQLASGKGDLYATLHTSMGDITAKLYEKEAPNTVANFVGLARGTREWIDPQTNQPTTRPLYQDVTFHRVIPEFMIQGGDPLGSGIGGPGYRFADEFKAQLRHSKPGILSMANSGPNSNGSQFFITEVPTPHLDGRHSVFGEVVKNINLVLKIARVPADMRDKPAQPVVIKSIEIFRAENIQ